MHAPLSPASLLIARRAGRAAFGLTLAGGMLMTVRFAWDAQTLSWPFQPAFYGGQVLVLTWVLALLAGAGVSALARGVLEENPGLLFARAGGGPSAPVACPVGLPAGAIAARRIEPWGLALPLVGLSLAAPLSLHWLVGALLGVDARDFNHWITLSSILVSHAHLALGALAAIYALALCRSERTPASFGAGTAILVTLAVSAMPGLFLFGLPPLLTGATAAVFVPAMFAWARRTLESERALLASAERARR